MLVDVQVVPSTLNQMHVIYEVAAQGCRGSTSRSRANATGPDSMCNMQRILCVSKSSSLTMLTSIYPSQPPSACKQGARVMCTPTFLRQPPTAAPLPSLSPSLLAITGLKFKRAAGHFSGLTQIKSCLIPANFSVAGGARRMHLQHA
jgi:hypothetical protein